MKIKQMAQHLNRVPVRKKAKQLLAVTLAVLMVNPVTGYSVSAHAQEVETITAIAKLSGEIATQQLAVGSEESDIQLPDTLDVTIRITETNTVEKKAEVPQPVSTTVEESQPVEGTPEELKTAETPADDSTVSDNEAKEPQDASENAEDKETAEEPQPDESTVEEPQDEGSGTEGNTATDSNATLSLHSSRVPLAASTTSFAIPADIDDTDTEQTEYEEITLEERTLTGITWEINGERSSADTFESADSGAVFFYEPVLPEDYVLADGVSLPQIQVQIEDSGKWAFNQSKIIDGIEITVRAGKDVFPEGAVLHAEKITGTEDKEKIQNAVSEEVKSEETPKTVTELVSFDITITDADGNELQPDTSKGEVKVTFAQLPMAPEDTAAKQELKVFHMDDSLNEAEELETIVNQEEGTLEAPAEHFSVFSVMLLKSGTEGKNITLSETYIYANGNAVIVKAGTDSRSLLYIDKGIIGTFEEGKDTVVDLNVLGITDGNTTDGYDLSTFRIFGGSKEDAVSSTNITILSGTIGGFYGGGDGGGATAEDTNVIVSGGTCRFFSYGGGRNGAVTGNTNITIAGGNITTILGGGYKDTVTGNTNITFTGGTNNQEVYGGGWDGTVTGNTNISITGETSIRSVYGGGSNGTVTGNTNITVTGGTINQGVHGGDISGTVSGTRNGVVVSVIADNASFDNGILKTGDVDYIAKGTISLPSDFDFTLPAGANLTVQEGAAIVNEGNLVIEGTMVNNGEFLVTGTLNISGTLDNKGTLSLNDSSCLAGTDNTLSGGGTFRMFGDPTGDMIAVPANLIYNDTDLTETAKSAIFIDTTKTGKGTLLNHEFQVFANSIDGWVLSINPAVVKEAGTYTAAFTKGSKTITTTFSISDAAATGNVVIASTDMNSNSKLDSGDTVTADLSSVIPAGGTASYQWKKISGGTTVNIGTDQNTYTLTSGDTKGRIFCEVTFTGNTTGMISSNKLDITKEILTGSIAITGENTEGSALTVSLPTNAGISGSDYDIQWYRDNAAIIGANAVSYNIAKEDLGKTLKVVITAKEASDGFTGTLTSNVFTVLAIAPDKAVVSASSGNGYVTLNWTKPYANGSDITGYSLVIKQGEAQMPGSPFTIGAEATSYKVENLTNGTEYTFILTTINGEGSTVSDTVTEKPKKPSDSGGSSDNGSSSEGSSTTTPAATSEMKPNPPVAATAPVTATAGTNGEAFASITDKAINDAIAKAQSDAISQGKTANGISVELNVTLPKGTASLNAALTRSSLDSLVSAGVNSLEINGSLVKVSFDKKALTEIQTQSTGNISIAIAPKTNLSDEAKKIIGTRPVYDITVRYGSDKRVSSFGGGAATVSIPYTLGRNEAVGGLYAVYVDNMGNATRIADSAYDANSGCVIFTTPHFSQYGIGYTAPAADFTDISSHWAKESIDYVVGRGLLSGTSDTAFSPDFTMTRGILVTALGRLAGVDTKAYAENRFTDVNADSAYRPYIEWAYSKGIMQGIGGSQFAPDREITREEIAVIFVNYAKETGYTLPITREAITYADASSIGSAYKDAVKAMQQAGIMMGGSDNTFNPKGNVTRGEVSSLLNRYIKLTINTDTAQGWALNDAGQYLYYKDGLMISGKWIEIDGKWYYFYTDGSLARSTQIDGYEIDENGVRKTK